MVNPRVSLALLTRSERLWVDAKMDAKMDAKLIVT
jgi:hypothetical protein